MYLKAKWNETRIPAATVGRVESEIEDFLVDHFGSASAAFNAKAAFVVQHKPANHPWPIGLNKAIDLATRGISPGIKQGLNIQLKFFDE